MVLLFTMTPILINYNKSILMEWSILMINSVSIKGLVLMDLNSWMFIFTVLVITMTVVKYSYYYLHSNMVYKRYIMVLLLFVASMMLLIISPNMVSMLLGWDFLGLSSYLLVVFYSNSSSTNAGMLTALSNRMGDAGIMVLIMFLFSSNSWNYMMMDKSSNFFNMMIIITSFTKSAQIPFCAWLPAAMAAPTPISALVHSSTLVTAGVYLMIRASTIMQKELYLLFIVGSMTTIMAGVSAYMEMDMKKIIALSTLSQLGLMIMVIGMNKAYLSFFHLIMHALFKSSLFMGMGVLIHTSKSSQNPNISGNMTFNPYIVSNLMLPNMALMGFPFLAGFFSKDLVMENSLSMNMFFSVLLITSASVTLVYSLRLSYLSMSASRLMSLTSMTKFLNKFNNPNSLMAMSVFMGFVSYFTTIEKSNMNSSMMKFMMIITMVILLILTNIMFKYNTLMKYLVIYIQSMWNMSIISRKMAIVMMNKVMYNLLDLGFLTKMQVDTNYKMMNNVSFNIQLTQKSLIILIYMFTVVMIMILIN